MTPRRTGGRNRGLPLLHATASTARISASNASSENRAAQAADARDRRISSARSVARSSICPATAAASPAGTVVPRPWPRMAGTMPPSLPMHTTPKAMASTIAFGQPSDSEASTSTSARSYSANTPGWSTAPISSTGSAVRRRLQRRPLRAVTDDAQG